MVSGYGCLCADGLIRETALGFPKRSHIAIGLNTFSSLDMPQSDKCNDSFTIFFIIYFLYIYIYTYVYVYV